MSVTSKLPLTPRQRYQQDLRRDGFVADSSQAEAVDKLQALYDGLLVNVSKPGGWFTRLRGNPEPPTVQGIYFWGGVGRGKTYLMDNFYESLPFEGKMRTHFHRFMKRVHSDLNALSGQKNPLEKVAAGIAKDTRVICFDEFFVSDITDAMVLGTLMQALFARGVTLVATSNIIPAKLYENGLQRQRFLPTINLIEQHCEVVNLDGGVDYRLRALTQAELYHWPLDDRAEEVLLAAFESLVPSQEEVKEGVLIEVEGRDIRCRYVGEDVVWFDFETLCAGPRSQNDYIELAREFHAVLLSAVPRMGAQHDSEARRFINMIDEFYDRGVKVALSAAVSPHDLYEGGALEFEFERTVSRILEMQSHDYLACEHRP